MDMDTGITDTGITDTGITDTGITDTGITDTELKQAQLEHRARAMRQKMNDPEKHRLWRWALRGIVIQ